ncbi:hypothetical protein GS876_23530 [Rhodococcus hoagii]|nr:hypothetical protein [Prescottella equi]MBM4581023.1 hypothetical protein [Prescottella equi]MBM4685648.1 hypothetical protein [Prescottella equi]NKU31540.1 hypothetical protein [Prescottella equi]NKU51923.1 hypothetical protein [Prescottella equi]
MISIVRAYAAPPPPWRVQKVGTFLSPSSGQWVDVPGWAASPGYPEDAVSAGGIVALTAATVNITAVLSRQSTAANSWGVRIVHNGTELSSTNSGGSSSKTTQAVVTGLVVAEGDLLTVRYVTAFLNSSGTLEETNTYLEVTAA